MVNVPSALRLDGLSMLREWDAKQQGEPEGPEGRLEGKTQRGHGVVAA